MCDKSEDNTASYLPAAPDRHSARASFDDDSTAAWTTVVVLDSATAERAVSVAATATRAQHQATREDAGEWGVNITYTDTILYIVKCAGET